MDAVQAFMNNHGLHLQLFSIIIAILIAIVTIIRFLVKYNEKRLDATSKAIETYHEATRQDLCELKTDNKEMARDIGEIKRGMVQFVTREEYRKSLDRIHGRLDILERGRIHPPQYKQRSRRKHSNQKKPATK